MKMIRVKSSNIDAIGHESGVLEVHFKSGARYRYAGVSVAEWTKFKQSESKGVHFAQHIKTKGYEVTNVTPQKGDKAKAVITAVLMLLAPISAHGQQPTPVPYTIEPAVHGQLMQYLSQQPYQFAAPIVALLNQLQQAAQQVAAMKPPEAVNAPEATPSVK